MRSEEAECYVILYPLIKIDKQDPDSQRQSQRWRYLVAMHQAPGITVFLDLTEFDLHRHAGGIIATPTNWAVTGWRAETPAPLGVVLAFRPHGMQNRGVVVRPSGRTRFKSRAEARATGGVTLLVFDPLQSSIRNQQFFRASVNRQRRTACRHSSPRIPCRSRRSRGRSR
jgi:hypothetical protein